MKRRLLELVTNDDGKLSRTQVGQWIVFFLTVTLTVLEVAQGGGVLSQRVLLVLGGLHLYALADRIQAKFAVFHLGKDGADISLGGEAARAEAERLRQQ